MKGSLLLLTVFGAGAFSGAILDLQVNIGSVQEASLMLLLFCVGVGIGGDAESRQALSATEPRLLLVPVAIVVGTLGGTAAVAWALPFPLLDTLAVGSGLGYYSLSSVLIAAERGELLGSIALVTNVTRELLTLLLTPHLAAAFGPQAPIAAGGATAMDTTLPLIVRYCGNRWAAIAVFSGIVLTVAVPLLVGVFLRMGG